RPGHGMRIVIACAVLSLATVLSTLPATGSTAETSAGASPATPGGGQADNVVLRWDAAALQAVRDSRLGPPMVARALAVVHTCMYDAWAAYDNVAIGTRLGGSLRRPAGDRTLENKSVAVSRGDRQRRRERGARLWPR